MYRIRNRFVAGLLLIVCSIVTAHAQSYTKPKVRAITAFVRIERPQYAQQITAALKVLGAARSEFEHRGYTVEGVRIVTQPLGELVAGQSDSDALAFLKTLDTLSAKEQFALNLGPGMLRDADDPHTMQLLARALSTLPNANASAIIAGDDGIH